MSEKEPLAEILKRKFGPVSDWKPAGTTESVGQGLKSILNEAQKGMESLGKLLEPLSDDAKAKVKEAAATLEDVATKSSKEARSFLARTLETVAGKIKPES